MSQMLSSTYLEASYPTCNIVWIATLTRHSLTAMQAHDREAAATLHMELLTKGSQTDDIGLWMSALKQLLMRL